MGREEKRKTVKSGTELFITYIFLFAKPFKYFTEEYSLNESSHARDISANTFYLWGSREDTVSHVSSSSAYLQLFTISFCFLELSK